MKALELVAHTVARPLFDVRMSEMSIRAPLRGSANCGEVQMVAYYFPSLLKFRD
jgi:hypothetical protein